MFFLLKNNLYSFIFSTQHKDIGNQSFYLRSKKRDGFFTRFIKDHLINYPTPININYMWSFGSLAGVCLVIQILSGLFLAMYYVPDTKHAFDSIEYIMRDVKNGWFVRYLHSNGASMFFIVLYLHIARGLYWKSFIYPRIGVWYSGVIILLLVMATAFMGYVLPWGQMSYWGAVVITNFVSAIPYIGPPITRWIWGGYTVGKATLGRFFAIHFVLPFVIAALSFIHILLLHEVGSSNPLGVLNPVKITFYPYFFFKDLFAINIMLFFLGILVFYYPNVLSHPDNYVKANPYSTPKHIVPEWYFLPFYAILRSVPNKLLGILAMFGSILILFILPFIETSNIQGARFKPIFKIFFFLLMADILLLFWLGAQPIEYPFVSLSRFCTFYYFLSFLVIIPLVGAVENVIHETELDKAQAKIDLEKSKEEEKLFKEICEKDKKKITQFKKDLDKKKNIKSKILSLKEYHPFHIVDPSPWPFFTSFSLMIFLSGMVMIMHNVKDGFFFLSFFFLLVFFMFRWWYDCIKEATFEKKHSLKVISGFRNGMKLFIASEVMFFFSFFWAFFYASINPTLSLGCTWPPEGIQLLDPYSIPLLNTLILLTSGVWITYNHTVLLINSHNIYQYIEPVYKKDIIKSLICTIFLGIIFSFFQYFEYINSSFDISDSIYGSTFYMTTGFHGLHVLIGTIFLFICLIRFYYDHLNPERHVSFELAIWYWHFVDIVWIFLYIFVYIWGSCTTKKDITPLLISTVSL